MQVSRRTAAPQGAGSALLLALLVGANLMWGSSWVIAKFLLATVGPLQIAAWRMILAGALLAPLTLWQARRGLLPWRSAPALLFLALIGFVLPKAFNLWGVNLSTASSASLLMSIEPLFTLLLGVAILRERVTSAKAAALAFGAVGAYLIVAQGLVWPDWSSAHALGDLIFTAGLVLEAGYSVLGKGMLGRHSPLAVTSATISAALVFWLPVAGWDLAVNGWPAVTPGIALAIFYLSAGLTVIGYWIWFFALQHVDAGRVGLTIFVQPLFGTLLSVWVLGEQLTLATWAGGALVLVSLGLALRPERSPPGRS
jgi:drug/metabolite transporter (DMT)-like permease